MFGLQSRNLLTEDLFLILKPLVLLNIDCHHGDTYSVLIHSLAMQIIQAERPNPLAFLEGHYEKIQFIAG